MRSNSLGPADTYATRYGLTPRSSLKLLASDIGSPFIEHAIHKLEAIGAAERFGQFDRLVYGYLVGNLEVMDEFEAAYQQNAVFYGGELFERTIDIRHEALTQRGSFAQHAVQQGFEPSGI